MLNLDILSFQTLAESALRLDILNQHETAWLNSVGFNDPKRLLKQVKEARKVCGHDQQDGDDLVAQIGGGC